MSRLFHKNLVEFGYTDLTVEHVLASYDKAMAKEKPVMLQLKQDGLLVQDSSSEIIDDGYVRIGHCLEQTWTKYTGLLVRAARLVANFNDLSAGSWAYPETSKDEHT